MRAVLTPEDLSRTDSIPPGWYPAEITKYDEDVTKGSDQKPSDGSVNAIFFFTLLDGPAKGREIRRYLNEKALYFGKNLYSALKFPKNSAGGYDVSTELFRQTVGSRLEIYIKKNQNTGFDSVEDFRPMKAA